MHTETQWQIQRVIQCSFCHKKKKKKEGGGGPQDIKEFFSKRGGAYCNWTIEGDSSPHSLHVSEVNYAMHGQARQLDN